MSDKVAEGPHAKAKQTYEEARGCSLPWIFSTMRLKQNLDDVDELIRITDSNLQHEWFRYKCVKPVKPYAYQRSAITNS